MSLLTPLLPNRRRTGQTDQPADSAVAATAAEWHVGLSQKGMFPHHEASCPCAKAACGLAIPRPDVLCPVHQGPEAYQQLHRASECGYPRQTWLPRSLLRKQLSPKHGR